MEVPESVRIGLEAIRPTFRLVWNPQGRVVAERSLDVNGNAREKTYEPRWELWDTDPLGVHYRVMTLESFYGGAFLPADERFLDFVRLIDPARYDGSIEKMVHALVDSPNELAREIADRDYERLLDALGSYYTPEKGNSMVTVR